jgi:predicted ArsR family transcriptional regulator
MLEQLLAEIRTGETFTIADLAARLKTSPQMIRSMIEQLVRSGMIHSYTPPCQDTCQACTLANQCHDTGKIETSLWVLGAD